MITRVRVLFWLVAIAVAATACRASLGVTQVDARQQNVQIVGPGDRSR